MDAHNIFRRTLRVLGFGVVFLCWCLFFQGCAIVEMKKQEKVAKESSIIIGWVSIPSQVTGPLIVTAYKLEKNTPVFAHYTVLHGAGEYELMVREGHYHIFAFQDENSNLVYDQGEPAGQFGENDVVWAPSGGVVGPYDILMAGDSSSVTVKPGTVISKVKPKKLYSRMAGARYPLDCDLFSEENGMIGYWNPLNFYREIGGNIYFLEEFDPDKIPILFIHGATGTPKGWQYFVENIDRQRFQPWFYYYPSGSRIKSMSYLLFWKLMNLQKRHKFETLYLTAHSMGGLVARSFLIEHGKSFPNVHLFISLATPWGGDHMASYGVQQSPVVIPSWIDMQPEGPFITSLFGRKLPENVNFYMFYGYRGNRNPLRSNNDGTISLASLLDNRSQKEADMNYAFNEDHTSLIFSKPVVDQYNVLIQSLADKNTSTDQNGGYVDLKLTGYRISGSTSEVTLVLRPVKRDGGEIMTWTYPCETGSILGPFPEGEYRASLLALAFTADNREVPIVLKNGVKIPLSFSMQKEGVILGNVTTASNSENRLVGMPATEFLPPDEKVSLDYITVRGKNVERTIRAKADKTVDFRQVVRLRKDTCSKDKFVVFNLPEGRYHIEVKARGYKKASTTYEVIAGSVKNTYISELIPE